MEIIRAPDPKLRAKTRPVKKISHRLVGLTRDMIKLAKSFHDPEGVGLASTQIGEDGCFFVALTGKTFKVFINPQIISLGKRTKKYFEGCLSIPNYFGHVKRPTQITVSYQDLTGKTITQSLKGIPAWIFQHEMDHLDSILFPDKVLQQKGKFYKFSGRDKTGTDIFEEVTI